MIHTKIKDPNKFVHSGTPLNLISPLKIVYRLDPYGIIMSTKGWDMYTLANAGHYHITRYLICYFISYVLRRQLTLKSQTSFIILLLSVIIKRIKKESGSIDGIRDIIDRGLGICGSRKIYLVMKKK